MNSNSSQDCTEGSFLLSRSKDKRLEKGFSREENLRRFEKKIDKILKLNRKQSIYIHTIL